MTHIAHLEYNIMSFEIVTLNLSHCELHPPPNPTQPNPSPQISSSFPILHQTCLFQLFSNGLEVFVLASICPLCWDSQPPGESSTAKMGLLGVTLTQHNEHLPARSMMLTMFGERMTIFHPWEEPTGIGQGSLEVGCIPGIMNSCLIP